MSPGAKISYQWSGPQAWPAARRWPAIPVRFSRAAGHRECRWGAVTCGSMNRTDRLYALVEELRAVAPRPRSARQLAQRYEVSTRTIERDILALQESGVPI